LRAFLQFPFSHLDHLESKHQNSQMSTVSNLMNGKLEDVEARKAIFISKMKELFLEQMI
jgi:formate dehydrogenase maturation protein FdhE